MRAGAVPNALAGSWESITHTGLPCAAQIQGGCLVLHNLICYALFIPTGPVPF